MTQALNGQIESENNSANEVAWKETAAEIRCDRIPKEWWRNDRKCKCRQGDPIPVSRTVLLHDLVIGLTVFILNEGTTMGRRSHIIGFDMISADAEIPNITLGHRLPGSQVTINFYGRHLRGFTVVNGDGGICALRPVFDSESTGWLGDSEQGEKIMQLILKDDVKAISAKFDVSHFCQYDPRIYAKGNKRSIARWSLYP